MRLSPPGLGSFRWVASILIASLAVAASLVSAGSWSEAFADGTGGTGTGGTGGTGGTDPVPQRELRFRGQANQTLPALVFDSVGDEEQVRLYLANAEVGDADTLQVLIGHNPSITSISNPECIEEFAGAISRSDAVYVPDKAGTAMVCARDGAPLSGDGNVLEFTVTKVDAGEDTLTLISSGSLATRMFKAGAEIPFEAFPSLLVSGGVAPTQTPTPTSPPSSGGGGGGGGGGGAPAPPPAARPGQPTDVQAVPGDERATITWQPPGNNGGSILIEFRLYIFGGGSYAVPASETAFTVTGLENGTAYQFSVAATNAVGSSEPSAVSEPVTPFGRPMAPRSVIVSSPASGTLRVAWQAPSSDEGSAITEYRITEVSGKLDGRTVDAESPMFADFTDVSPGTYAFRVVARNAAGEGDAATSSEFLLKAADANSAGNVVRRSDDPPVSDTDLDELEQAVKDSGGQNAARTDGDSDVSVSDGAGRVTLPITVDESISTATMSVQTDTLRLDVTNGQGTVSVNLGSGISITGAASLGRDESGLMTVNVESPRLVLQPAMAGSAAGGAEFDVGLLELPSDAGFTVTYSDDAESSGVSTAQLIDTAIAAGIDISESSAQTGFTIRVELTGIDNSRLTDNVVTLLIDSGWAGFASGRSVYLVKISDTGEVYVRRADCVVTGPTARCSARFVGPAGGFSSFTTLSASSSDQVVPTATPTAAPTATPTLNPTTPSGTATPAPTEPAGIAVPLGETPTAGDSTSSEPTPTASVSIGPGADASGGTSGGTIVLIIAGVLVVVGTVGAGGVFVYSRRGRVPASLVLLLAAGAAAIALPLDTMAVANEGDPPFTGINLSADMVGRLRDQLPYQYRRMDSATNAAYRTAIGQPSAMSAGALDEQGNIDVYVWHDGENSASITDVVEQIGGTVYNMAPDVIEASVPAELLPALNYATGVLRVSQIVPPVPLDHITSQGVAVHNADSWQALGLDGSGVKVGVIDVGFLGYSDLVGTELTSPVGVRCYTTPGAYTANISDCESETVHGTAVAEAATDIAPRAEFYIANPISTTDLRNTVVWMADQGVQIINYSVGWTWFFGPGDGTSIYSSAPVRTVDQAVAGEILWVNAAGNEGDAGWYGEWNDPDEDGFLNFSSGFETQAIVATAGTTLRFQLRWEDSWPAATTNLDLLILNSSLSVVASSTIAQAGGGADTPYEFAAYIVPSTGTYHVVIGYAGGPIPDWLQVQEFGGRPISDPTPAYSIGNPAESANPGMLAVGAAHHTTTSAIEDFSSQGPTTDERVKPDIVGADGAISASNGSWIGTSQASPHVAGMAALILQRYPGLTPAELADFLKNNALERGASGADNVWGHGFAQLPALLPPVGTAESYNVIQGNVLAVSAAQGVLSNDTDPEDDPITAVLRTTTPNGTLALNADGSFTYTPDTDFTGTDTFTYRASDGLQESADVTVTLNVAATFAVSGTVALESIADGAVLAAIAPVVTITLEGESGTLTANVGTDGSFVIEGVVEGTHSISVTAGGFLRATDGLLDVAADVTMPAVELLIGNADGDNDIDLADLQIIADSFATEPGADREDSSGRTVDLDADGIVTGRDLSLALQNVETIGLSSW